MNARRELRLAVLLCLIGSGLVLLAVARTWVSYRTGDVTIRDVTAHLSGTRVRPSLQGLGLVGLTGVVALAATRSWGRLVVGTLVAAAGAAIIAVVVGELATNARELVPRDCGGAAACYVPNKGIPGAELALERSVVWPMVTAVGGALLLVAGGLVAVRGRRWAALSASYEVKGEALPPATDKGVWDALDRGDDPTA